MNRPLRILQMAHVRWYNAEAQYAHDLSCECRKRGHKVVFFTQSGSPAAEKARHSGLETYEEGGFNAKGLGAAGIFPALLRLMRLMDEHRFDAVEIHRSEAMALAAAVCRLKGIPVIRVRGDKRPFKKGYFNRFIYGRALSAVVASNYTIEKDLKKRIGPLARVATIHGGVDPDCFTPNGEVVDIRSLCGCPPDAILVGLVGRLGGDKGHLDFVAAADLCISRNDQVHFLVLAKESNPLEEELRRRIDANPRLTSNVTILGHQADLPAVMRAFDVGVVASTASEANCRVGLEWMASGVPLVGTRIGVLPDLIDENKSGFIVPPREPEKLAERIGYLADNPAAARQMGRCSRQRVLEKFSIQGCARKHLKLIRELM